MIKDSALNVIEKEIEGIEKLKMVIDDTFEEIVLSIVNCHGKVVFSGIGKSGHVARKISATMASLGCQSIFIHSAEALHGDLGIVSSEDIAVLVSNSGETDEILRMIPILRMRGTKVIGITGKRDSRLAKESDIVQILPDMEEACHLSLAPTTTTTACMVYGDALAVAASEQKGFTKELFALNHPCGTLGKHLLLEVNDIMIPYENSAVIDESTEVKDALIEMCSKSSRIGVVLKDGLLLGVITDGDIRRILKKGEFNGSQKVEELYTRNAIVIEGDSLAVNALEIMKKNNISALPVIDKDHCFIGTVGFQQLMLAGLG